MGFWTDLLTRPTQAGETANPNPPSSVGPSYTAGVADGFSIDGGTPNTRALPRVLPSPWSGWPAEWSVPNWDFGSRFNELVDVAWTCLDLNSSVLSTMPIYRTKDGRIIPPETWMANPDPFIYSSWQEFAKQLFWDYQLGEVFVLPMARFSTGFPMTFRVVPPWLVDVELSGGRRIYRLGGPGGQDVTDEILHIRYKSDTASARGVGALENAGARMVTAGVLAKYVREVVATGGINYTTLETDAELEEGEAQDLLNDWVAARSQNLAAPPVLDRNVQFKIHTGMSPSDMAMLEIAQFTEGRIAVLLGVPGFLIDLPGGDDMTYSNVSQVFDYHDRRALRPLAGSVMPALSYWALPRGQAAELNRDEYSRPSFTERANAWAVLVEKGIVSIEEVREAERFTGERPTVALTGGDVQ